MLTKRAQVLASIEAAIAYWGNDCLIWPHHRTNRGYGRIQIDGREVLVSRIVCRYEHGLPPTPKHEAAHSCGNGHLGCVTRRHLSWKTHAENMADAVAHGTVTHGLDRFNAKITEADVHEIRRLRGQESQRSIGARFGISHTVVWKIQTGEDWAHIDSGD